MNDEAQDIQNPSSPGEASPQPDPARAPAPRKKRSKAAANAEIEGRIGYKFKDSALLKTAFMHVSALQPATRHPADSYHRLEFLGDHVLGLIVSDMLYRAYPRADEGELSKRLRDLGRKGRRAGGGKPGGL